MGLAAVVVVAIVGLASGATGDVGALVTALGPIISTTLPYTEPSPTS